MSSQIKAGLLRTIQNKRMELELRRLKLKQIQVHKSKSKEEIASTRERTKQIQKEINLRTLQINEQVEMTKHDETKLTESLQEMKQIENDLKMVKQQKEQIQKKQKEKRDAFQQQINQIAQQNLCLMMMKYKEAQQMLFNLYSERKQKENPNAPEPMPQQDKTQQVQQNKQNEVNEHEKLKELKAQIEDRQKSKAAVTQDIAKLEQEIRDFDELLGEMGIYLQRLDAQITDLHKKPKMQTVAAFNRKYQQIHDHMQRGKKFERELLTPILNGLNSNTQS